jgi:hypothetical protein
VKLPLSSIGGVGKTAYWTLWFFCGDSFLLLQNDVYFQLVIASRYKRRGDPGFLDSVVADSPRNDVYR